ncbi:hypothetical protein OG21DRAFT_1504748 [Imleria badia]|nr:hypothetical protein OG21DRAFT_1504748 [Imleria badia]
MVLPTYYPRNGYIITKKVADEEHSVLYANAVHHRSDAYSSMIALLPSWARSSFQPCPSTHSA